jgi:hypothetical protein
VVILDKSLADYERLISGIPERTDRFRLKEERSDQTRK